MKECSNYHTIALISHASKVILRILQVRLQDYVNHGVPDVQAEEPETNFPTSAGSLKKQKVTEFKYKNIKHGIHRAKQIMSIDTRK